jgi:hypothetical protein
MTFLKEEERLEMDLHPLPGYSKVLAVNNVTIHNYPYVKHREQAHQHRT